MDVRLLLLILKKTTQKHMAMRSVEEPSFEPLRVNEKNVGCFKVS